MKKDKYADTMRPEYDFSDFKEKGVRGKYYKRIMREGIKVVVLKTKRSRRPGSPRNGRKRAAA